MVNYCCVFGCGRNSKQSSHLNFYSLPKEKHRLIEWLKAANREDLVTPDLKTSHHRVCSRHFLPTSIKGRNLCADAVPTLHLSGSCNEDTADSPLPHEGIVCNNCNNPVLGFRYKCVTCLDYDLCQKCEQIEVHREHFMLRIPKPMKFRESDDLIKKWQKFLKSENIKTENDSSDDEPITKYVKLHATGMELSEDEKNRIRKEVTRVLSIKSVKKKKTKEKNDRKAETAPAVGDMRVVENAASVPEVVFADVNNMDMHSDVKQEFNFQNMLMEQLVQENQEPVQMHVKLSDDLTQLMIQVENNQDKSVYIQTYNNT